MLSLMREQKGSVAILTAFSLIVLLGFTALVADLGLLYLKRSQLINIADAAALAGVQELPGKAAAAQAVAEEYAAQNGKNADSVQIELANSNREIAVSVARNVTLFFARIFDYPAKTVSANAVAAVRPISSVSGVVPFGVVKQEFIYGETYTLKEGAGEGFNGNYGGLALGGKGANTYRYNIKYGYDGKLHIGTRPPNIEGKGAITMRDLVRNSLRMRPDRIVVGEVRSGEALDMLQAMNTGHDGSLTTGHANTPRDMLSRLETMVLMAGMDLPVRAIREQIASAIDVIVQQSRLRDGSRKITHITEVQGMEGDVVTLQDIFVFEPTGKDEQGKICGKFKPTGIRPKFLEKLAANGITVANEVFWPK